MNNNLLKFEVLENLSNFTDSMLFDSGLVIAHAIYEKDGNKIDIELRVVGEVDIDYKDSNYRYPSDFPAELKTLIKNDRFWYNDPDVYVSNNNWFEYIYTIDYKYSDGVLMEGDLDKYTSEELKSEIEDICEQIIVNNT